MASIVTVSEGRLVDHVRQTPLLPQVEVVGTDQATADGFLRRLRELMHEHNAFRRKDVSFTFGMHGEFGLSFVKLPQVDRSDVVLGSCELEAIEAHSIGITDHADGLRAAGGAVRQAGTIATTRDHRDRGRRH